MSGVSRVSHVVVLVHSLRPALEVEHQFGLIKSRLFVVLSEARLKTEFFFVDYFAFSHILEVRLFVGTSALVFEVERRGLCMDFGLLIPEGILVRSEPHSVALHSFGSSFEVILELGLVDLGFSEVLGKGVVQSQGLFMEYLMVFFLH